MAPKTLISKHFFNDLLVCYMNSIQPLELFSKKTCVTLFPTLKTCFSQAPLLGNHPFHLPPIFSPLVPAHPLTPEHLPDVSP